MTSIELRDLTKEYGRTRAVDGLTFDVLPGRVTGFLGPNGAGKSTALRLLLGLDRPTGGTATIGGRSYASLRAPLRRVGALLDAHAPHPSRTAHHHLLALALSNGITARRVDEVLDEVGLRAVARHRIRTFSLGMRQRLGLAAALLGDPDVVLLDEPSNGLDAQGIIWVRELVRRLAREGRTVLVSSHLMQETAAYADHLVVLGRGRLLADTPIRSFLGTGTTRRVRLRVAENARLPAALARAGLTAEAQPDDRWTVNGARAADVGARLAREDITVLELTEERTSLEEAYLALTAGAAAFSTAGRVPGPLHGIRPSGHGTSTLQEVSS